FLSVCRIIIMEHLDSAHLVLVEMQNLQEVARYYVPAEDVANSWRQCAQGRQNHQEKTQGHPAIHGQTAGNEGQRPAKSEALYPLAIIPPELLPAPCSVFPGDQLVLELLQKALGDVRIVQCRSAVHQIRGTLAEYLQHPLRTIPFGAVHGLAVIS